MASPVLLLMAQVDDAPGELLGAVLTSLAEAGAKNVQLLSSLGKKGRPGYVLMIDIPANLERRVAAILAGDLGVWGYRVLESQHKHFDIERHAITLEIRLAGAVHHHPMRVKRILDAGVLMRVKAEHDDLAAICRALGTQNRPLGLTELKAHVEARVGTGTPPEILPLDLD